MIGRQWNVSKGAGTVGVWVVVRSRERGFFNNNAYFAFYFKAIKTEPLCWEMFRRLVLQGAEPDFQVQTVHFPHCAALNRQLKTRNQVTWKNKTKNNNSQVTHASKRRADVYQSSTTFCKPDFLFVCMWRASAQWEDTLWSAFTQFFTHKKRLGHLTQGAIWFQSWADFGWNIFL